MKNKNKFEFIQIVLLSCILLLFTIGIVFNKYMSILTKDPVFLFSGVAVMIGTCGTIFAGKLDHDRYKRNKGVSVG